MYIRKGHSPTSEIQAWYSALFNRYYEPFVGGGAVVFELLPEDAIINDINKALINTYRQISNKPKIFLEEVKELDENIWEDGKEYYYSIRERYNNKLIKEEYRSETNEEN